MSGFTEPKAIMRIPKDKKYCSSLVEADQYLESVKFVPCPHCAQIGCLIGHGFLKGYDSDSDEKVIRCRRFSVLTGFAAAAADEPHLYCFRLY